MSLYVLSKGSTALSDMISMISLPKDVGELVLDARLFLFDVPLS